MSGRVADLQISIVRLPNTVLDNDLLTREAVAAGGEAMAIEIRKHISRRDHTLKDLAKKDHPYARRHGTIQTSVLGGAFVQHPSMVHQQTGTLLSAYRHAPITDAYGQPAYQVWVDRGIAPHFEDVVLGTDVMLPRDPLYEAAKLHSTRRAIMRAVVKRLGPILRSKAGIRFGKGKVHGMSQTSRTWWQTEPTRNEGAPHTTEIG